MGLLDQIAGQLGKEAGGGLADVLKGQGGVGGLVEALGKGGLGDVAASWVGKGGNLPISPEQLQAVLGSGPIADFARKMGVSPEQASEVLAGLLPEAVDRATPGGVTDGADDLLDKLPGGLGGIIGGFMKG